MELKMELSQKQVLSQHMVQSMEILQMSAQELEGYRKVGTGESGDRAGRFQSVKSGYAAGRSSAEAGLAGVYRLAESCILSAGARCGKYGSKLA